MTDDLKVEYFLLRIREKLNKDKIKLWLPPYLHDEKSESEGVDFNALERLADKLNVDLEIDKNICVTALRELQKHALDKLHEREIYNETGVAVIKVKLSGFNSTNSNSYNNNNSSPVNRILSIRINLSSFTSALCKAVSDETDIPSQGIKLISRGKILNNTKSLESQGVKHGVQIMAVVLSSSSSDLREYEKHIEILERMKGDVKLLTNSVGPEEDTYLQVADQSGKTLQLPQEEKKALVTAMALHEKGRAALKKEEYALALVFLLEADKEFSNCNSQLLNSVDNYGLLNLDIAWCYLCLRNVTQLPDAEQRLKVCESKFKYSYGPNLERLVALKGSSGNEAALLMRLHLLQGIVLFHQNKQDEARRILKEAQGELSMLKVDDNSICSLMELGLTAAEARIALRATKGCMNSAVEYIHRKRLEKEEIMKREKQEKEKRKLGLCKDGKQYIEPHLVAELETKGFSHTTAVEALRHANNEINGAIDVIHQQPELLIPAVPSEFNQDLLMELIGQVAAMGYEPLMAKQALRNHKGDLSRAVEELVVNNGIIPVHETESSSCSLSSSSSNNNNEMPSSSTSDQTSGIAKLANKLKKKEKEREAFDRFSEGIDTNVDDHLDLTLEQEEQFLMQYLSLLL